MMSRPNAIFLLGVICSMAVTPIDFIAWHRVLPFN